LNQYFPLKFFITQSNKVGELQETYRTSSTKG